VIPAIETEFTETVFTVKVAEVEFCRTVTLTGKVAFALFDDRLTTVPPWPAGPFKVTVPVEVLPPATAAGKSVTVISDAGVIVSVAVWLEVPSVPVSIADVRLETPVVVTVNVAELAPAAITTVAGTVAQETLEERWIVAPPVGAGPLSVTVPVEDVPPTTDVGATFTLTIVGTPTARV
jgi:hypothetical protein